MIAYRTMYDSVQSPSSPPSPPEFKSNYQRLVSNNEGDLRASVQRLEEQLDKARLRVRVMELGLSRQNEIEERLRMEVQMPSSSLLRDKNLIHFRGLHRQVWCIRPCNDIVQVVMIVSMIEQIRSRDESSERERERERKCSFYVARVWAETICVCVNCELNIKRYHTSTTSNILYMSIHPVQNDCQQ